MTEKINTTSGVTNADRYGNLAGLSNRLYLRANGGTEFLSADHFIARRATWSATEPIRVVWRGDDDGYDIVLALDGGRGTEHEAESKANYIRHALNLAMIDVLGRMTDSPAQAEHLAKQEKDHYYDWRRDPFADDTDEEADQIRADLRSKRRKEAENR